MKARITILAALPREIAPLVRDWPVRNTSRHDGYMIAQCERAIAVCAGMGSERAAYAFELATLQGPLHSVISVGYAGALRSGMPGNALHWPALVIDAGTGERFLCEQGSGTLITAGHVLNREEKLQAVERWEADLVDMEAAAIARMAQSRDVPFRALKVVSDELEDELPDFNRFIDVRGGFRETAFAVHIAMRPWLAPAAIRMGRRTTQASQAIAHALHEICDRAE